jgi:hypothetical protein
LIHRRVKKYIRYPDPSTLYTTVSPPYPSPYPFTVHPNTRLTPTPNLRHDSHHSQRPRPRSRTTVTTHPHHRAPVPSIQRCRRRLPYTKSSPTPNPPLPHIECTTPDLVTSLPHNTRTAEKISRIFPEFFRIFSELFSEYFPIFFEFSSVRFKMRPVS